MLMLPLAAGAQTSQAVYSDALMNGWLDYSYCTRNLANRSPVRTGSDSISAIITSAY